MTMNITIELTEHENGRVSFCLTFPNGQQASGTDLSIAKAAQEIGAAIYEQAQA